MIDRRAYLEHDIIWFYMTGEWPSDGVDHFNSDKTDNRWRNLRQATQSQNNANSRRRADNTSGFKGVCWYEATGKWSSRIGVGGKKINLGYFDKPHLAYAAYCLAARKHFGDFARCYEADQLIRPGVLSLLIQLAAA